jgi:hypothetical protein
MVTIMITETKKSGKNRPQKRAKRTRKKLKKAALDLGMTEGEIEESIKPLRLVFVRSLCTFLGR